ncbi:MAG TPA: dethiobiotin synthase [Jatrophihabitans sp.]|uniref:ATP-dependent dethiobiotin synthetase BioD n=1 Tax=Jatrophihabitans sp. TaxID=1932789 RepID=UPI002F0022BD
MNIVVVTGTGTGVGKTVTTAALAACALRAGQRVAVVKPVQTGVRAGEPGDLAEVRRLTGLTDLHEYARYAEPLAPATAARRLGESGPDLAELAGRIATLLDRDLVIIEGAGGALVRFNDQDEGICELVSALRELVRSPDSDGLTPRFQVVLVTGAGLGALHDAAASAAALASWSLGPDSLVVGDWPAEPRLAERCNLVDLAGYGGAPVRGVLPHGAGALGQAAFAELATAGLTPTLGGALNAPDFIRAHAVPPPRNERPR